MIEYDSFGAFFYKGNVMKKGAAFGVVASTFLLSLLGFGGCVTKGFACVYGGPPEDYETEEIIIEEVPIDDEGNELPQSKNTRAQ